VTNLSYLNQVRDAYLTARQRLEPHYREILRMNELQSQENLESLLSSSQLSTAEADRFRNLNLYFRLTKDLVSVGQEEAPPGLYERYANVVDAETGTWQPWFVEFARDERLTLPLPPLRVAFAQVDRSPRETHQLMVSYRQLLGPNPVQYFQQMRLSGNEQVGSILESMRRVKAQTKLLEFGTQVEAPVFEWLIAGDSPDLSSIGLLPSRLVTSWYFFESDEHGNYLLDEPSEAVIRQRVRDNLTDEEVFYALDIEHWELKGEPDVVEANLGKLRLVADLVHKYNPNLLIGYYRLLPRRDPHAAYRGAGSARHDAWQAHNDRVASSLEDAVDLLFPSLYTLHLGDQYRTTAERWTDYASGNLQEARRVADGKPVIPFLSLYYHPNGTRDGEPALTRNLKGWQWLEPELLLHQMIKAGELADGLVVFNDLRTDWNDLVDARLHAAIEAFHSASRNGQTRPLQDRYDELFTQHREELLAREAVERLLGEKLQARTRSRNHHPRLANLLNLEIDQLQWQLDQMIDFWDLWVGRESVR
jgi:hypothetical protein